MVRKWMIGIVSAVMVVTAAAQPLFAGPVFLDGGDRDDHGSFSAGANQAGWKLIEQALNFLRTNATNSGTGVLVIGASSTALAAVTSATTVLGLTQTVVTGAGITSATFSSYKILYVPSDSGNTGGGITDADNALLTARKAEIGSFVGAGGGLMMLTQQGLALPYSSVELPLPFTVSSSFTGPGGSGTLFQTAALAAAGFSISDAELSVGTPVHNAFTGPSGFNGLQVLITNGSGGTGDVITLGGGATTVFVPVMPPVALWAMAALLLLIGVTLVRRRQTA